MSPNAQASSVAMMTMLPTTRLQSRVYASACRQLPNTISPTTGTTAYRLAKIKKTLRA